MQVSRKNFKLKPNTDLLRRLISCCLHHKIFTKENHRCRYDQDGVQNFKADISSKTKSKERKRKWKYYNYLIRQIKKKKNTSHQ